MLDRLARNRPLPDNDSMEPSPQLEAFFELCKEIYLRRVADGTWPWPVDSTLSQDVIDSDSPSDL